MKTILLLVAAISGPFQGQPPSHPPKPAPRIYVSRKFGLVMKVPAGLSICPLPRNWSGSEEGTVLFLEPPSGCLDTQSTSSAIRVPLGSVPSITVHYLANAGRYDNFDGPIRAPRSSEELARQFCPQPVVAPQVKLFDQPAVTCRSGMSGEKVRIVLMAVYGSGRTVLLVSLQTTQDRLTKDESVLANVAAAITGCKVASDSKEDMPVCPRETTW